MKKPLYAKCYRDFDGELRRLGIRSQIGLMGGDLLLPNQKAWFNFIAGQMADILDAYSIHVYWDFSAPKKIGTRLTGVDTIRKTLPRAVREKPFYVMECGARGEQDAQRHHREPGSGRTDPGSRRRGSTHSSGLGSRSRRSSKDSVASLHGTPTAPSTTWTP